MKASFRPVHVVAIVVATALGVALVPVGVQAATTVMVLADRDN